MPPENVFRNIKSESIVYPTGNYMFKVNNGNTRTRCEIFSKLTIKTFIVNFESISHLVLVFLLLTLSR